MLCGPTWALWRLPQPDAWTLAAAALGVFWCLAPRGWPLRWAAPLTWLPLLMPAPPGPPPGSFRLTALDVGQGSSVLVETAHHALLFDAGPGPESTHASERVVVPFLQAHGVAALDMLIISHADSDHSGGAPAVLDAIDVHQWWPHWRRTTFCGRARGSVARRRCRARLGSVGSGTASSSRCCGRMPVRCRANRTRIVACCGSARCQAPRAGRERFLKRQCPGKRGRFCKRQRLFKRHRYRKRHRYSARHRRHNLRRLRKRQRVRKTNHLLDQHHRPSPPC
jgi:hypothetical protein